MAALQLVRPGAPPEHEDAALLSQAAGGDARAFSALYRRHARSVAQVVFRLMGDDLEVDDVVQDTFIDASEQLDQIREPGRLRSWLIAIAARKVSRRIRRRQRQRWLGRVLGTIVPLQASTVPEGEAIGIYRVLGSLPADVRVPWTLHVIEGMTLPDVAQACGVSLATVKRRITAASERLERAGIDTGAARVG